MIKAVDMENIAEAEEVWRLQHQAYRVEAQLIGFYDLPPLLETIHTLQNCGESFFGQYEDEELIGSLSYTIQDGIGTICRMMVHPKHFRKGIGSGLLSHLFDMVACRGWNVSTGTANEPALALYMRFGFREAGRLEVAPGVWITKMVK